MKKLFDETNGFENEFYRTMWYGYPKFELNENFKNQLVNIIKEDINIKQENKIKSHAWVIYFDEVHDDAINEKVRATIMIQEYDNVYDITVNMSDFLFVTVFKVIQEFIKELKNELNK